jgi:hypothetical protein
VIHFSKGRELVAVAQGANATRAAGYRLPLTMGYEFSLAKLFIDETLPAAGIGSTVVLAKALERRAVPRVVAGRTW